MADDRPTTDGELRPETRAIRAGRRANQDSVATPIWPSSTYELRDLNAASAMATQSLST